VGGRWCVVADKRWKATKRRIAALVGGRRVLVSGRGRGDWYDQALVVLRLADFVAWCGVVVSGAE
jgi:hypothetical protein